MWEEVEWSDESMRLNSLVCAKHAGRKHALQSQSTSKPIPIPKLCVFVNVLLCALMHRTPSEDAISSSR